MFVVFFGRRAAVTGKFATVEASFPGEAIFLSDGESFESSAPTGETTETASVTRVLQDSLRAAASQRNKATTNKPMRNSAGRFKRCLIIDEVVVLLG